MSASGVREIMNLNVHPMFLGTNFYNASNGAMVANCTDRSGLSTDASADCEIAQYYLCAEYGLGYDDDRWWDFIACGYRNQTELDNGADSAVFQGVIASCAAKYDLDADRLGECYASSEGARLLRYDYEHTTRFYTDAVWITVNGVEWTTDGDWLRAICDAYDGEKPSGCDSVATTQPSSRSLVA